ncbi:MAG: phospho-sugar mutase, partial [Clostridia bacterium]|nr:phospho-sugar mutase [Clostridia bacterium]
VMQDIYNEFGMYMNTLLNFGFAGADGMNKMKGIMAHLRENPPKEIAGMKVTKISDYLASEAVDTETGKKTAITLPKSNVLAYTLPDGNSAIIRPSGTEPKIKIYITAVGRTREDSQQLTDKISAAMKGFIGVE